MAAPAPAAPVAADPATTPQTSWAPTAKVSAGVLAASVTTLVIGYAKNHGWTAMDAADSAALTTVITFVIQYLVPERT